MLGRAKAALASLFGPRPKAGTGQVKIDLATEHPESGQFAIILVEVGPWPPSTEEAQLRRIQERLYGCVDVAVDGHLAAKYPSSKGRPVRIQLDAYDLPEAIVRPFFEKFAKHISTWPELQHQIHTHGFVQSLECEYNARVIDGNASP